ncbi:NAD(P)-dependent oxidoreductase [Rhodothermaceae bacterium RA]|nr:NAD(P)-dependent oxidoreductase [Rhodothermaceae bacterium RA]
MTISILGCGWLGLPLARHLIARGHRVRGSTTTPTRLNTLAEAGITPYLLTLDPSLIGSPVGDFFAADALVLNIPPGRRRPDVETYHARQIASVCDELRFSPIDFVVFVSSTSVYPDLNTTVVETDTTQPPESASGRALRAAEERLRADTHFDTTVLRFGGLYGYDRQPGRFLAGRTGLDNGGAPVNMLHRDDAVGIIDAVLTGNVRGEIFNAVADEHPSRADFYTRKALDAGLEPPTFADRAATAFKRVSNARLKQRLGYTFRHPDPLAPAP